MNLYQKLIKIREATPYIQKDSTNSFHKFKFTSSSAVLSTLRQSMDEHGVLLIPEIESFEVRDHTTRQGKHEYFTLLNMVFTWVNSENPDEKIKCPWHGQGLDDAEKGLGKALTYAEKFFLLKFFNIATDELDPDAFGRKQEPKQPAQPQQPAQPAQQPARGPGRPPVTPEKKVDTLIIRCKTQQNWNDAFTWLDKQKWVTEAHRERLNNAYSNWQYDNAHPAQPAADGAPGQQPAADGNYPNYQGGNNGQ